MRKELSLHPLSVIIPLPLCHRVKSSAYPPPPEANGGANSKEFSGQEMGGHERIPPCHIQTWRCNRFELTIKFPLTLKKRRGSLANSSGASANTQPGIAFSYTQDKIFPFSCQGRNALNGDGFLDLAAKRYKEVERSPGI
jgi:hypothetical protein